jgi:hypothetical protein
MIKRTLISGCLGLVSIAMPAFCSFSAVNDFPNTATVPVSSNGVWSYGYSLTLQPFNFQLATTATNNYFGQYGGAPGAVGFYTPETNASTGPYPLPAVLKNTTGANYSALTIPNWPPNVLLMHPGPNNEYSVIRFTAPTSATYSVTGLFTGLDDHGTTTDVHVSIPALGGSASQFSGNVNGFGPSSTQPFSFTAALTQGQSVDFAVGYGNNNLYYDSTGFDATITATPEPGFYGFLTLGLSGLLFAARLRKRA